MGTAGMRKYVATENISIHQDDNAQNCLHTRVKELWRKILWGHEGRRMHRHLCPRETRVLPRFQMWFSCPLHSLFFSSLKHWVFVCLLCAHRREKTEMPWPFGSPQGQGPCHPQGRLEENETKRGANTGRGSLLFKKKPLVWSICWNLGLNSAMTTMTHDQETNIRQIVRTEGRRMSHHSHVVLKPSWWTRVCCNVVVSCWDM